MAVGIGIAVVGCVNFNGAMAVRPWMGAGAAFSQIATWLLQWGHGREAMDGGKKRLPARLCLLTSMGPWP